jgi:hypothetical protein
MKLPSEINNMVDQSLFMVGSRVFAKEIPDIVSSNSDYDFIFHHRFR